MIKLGSTVRDNITGFTGIATSRTEYLFGCTRIAVEATELHDGRPIDAQFIDEQRLEVVTIGEPVISADSSATSGGPQTPPRRAPDPRR